MRQVEFVSYHEFTYVIPPAIKLIASHVMMCPEFVFSLCSPTTTQTDFRSTKGAIPEVGQSVHFVCHVNTSPYVLNQPSSIALFDRIIW
jgi:hypothetical protein